jgi:hypothetical protein
LQGGALERGVAIGMLQQEPRTVRSLVADEVPPRPTVLGQDETHPFEVRIENRILPRASGTDGLPCLDSLAQFSLDSLVHSDSGSDLRPQAGHWFEGLVQTRRFRTAEQCDADHDPGRQPTHSSRQAACIAFSWLEQIHDG